VNYDVTPSSHAAAYSATPATKLAAAAARTIESVNRFGDRWGIPPSQRYTDYHKMLDNEALDIVSVVTRADLHAEVVIEAAKKNVKGIIAEKAMATSAAEADAMIEACEERNVKLLINHPRRYHPVFRMAKEELESGSIGRLTSMRGAIWTFLIHNGSHLWDCFRYFAGDADWVSGTLVGAVSGDPAGYGVVHFRNDVFALADVATMQGTNMQLHGTDGMINIDMFSPGYTRTTYDDVISAGPDRPAYQFRPRRIKEMKLTPPPLTFTTPMQAAILDLIDCIEKNNQPKSSGHDGLAALEIGLAFHLSHANQTCRVRLPLKDREFRVVSR